MWDDCLQNPQQLLKLPYNGRDCSGFIPEYKMPVTGWIDFNSNHSDLWLSNNGMPDWGQVQTGNKYSREKLSVLFGKSSGWGLPRWRSGLPVSIRTCSGRCHKIQDTLYWSKNWNVEAKVVEKSGLGFGFQLDRVPLPGLASFPCGCFPCKGL